MGRDDDDDASCVEMRTQGYRTSVSISKANVSRGVCLEYFISKFT